MQETKRAEVIRLGYLVFMEQMGDPESTDLVLDLCRGLAAVGCRVILYAEEEALALAWVQTFREWGVQGCMALGSEAIRETDDLRRLGIRSVICSARDVELSRIGEHVERLGLSQIILAPGALPPDERSEWVRASP